MMDSVIIVRTIGILFALFLIYITFIKFKQNQISSKAFLLFGGVWIGFITICLMPSLFDPILDTIQFKRRLDFFIVIGFMFLISVCFYTYLKTQEANSKIEKIVAAIAINEAEKGEAE